MILDEVILTVAAGNGGEGAVSFRREKYIPKGGPDGGNGGAGADVYFVGTNDLAALNKFRSQKNIKAEDGGMGRSKKMIGKNAASLYVRIPIGTTITNTATGKKMNISDVGQELLIARGGYGGIGNWELRSAQNQTPREGKPAGRGEVFELHLNLSFIADVGLIGLPNAGKSSLLNAITNAQAKIGDYPFTTLEPNLGNLNGTIIADIPGLIEGASTGKGLGIKFLKHIEKTRVIVHCIDITTPDVLHAYHIVRKELKKYNPLLTTKDEFIFLTKKDLVTDSVKLNKIKEFKTISSKVFAFSIIDNVDIKKIITLLKKKDAAKP